MLRLIITAIFVSYFVDYAIPQSSLLGIFAIVAILFIIYYSTHLEKQSKGLTKRFTDNLSARERANSQKENKDI